ncbi:MAG: ATP-binding protein [Nitrospirota bacterium]
MEDEEIWQAIRSTVESGVETPKIDLKSDLSLNQPVEKAEFVKDVTAIANVGENVGYIVIGVRDKKDRVEDDLNDYFIGFDPPDLETRKQQMNQAIENYISPSILIRHYQLTHSQTGKKILVVEIPSNYNRPYIIKKDIDTLKKGMIFTRCDTHTQVASRDEIIRMTTEDIEIRHRDEIESVRKADEETILRLKKENVKLRHENYFLSDNKNKLDEERKNWQFLAYELCENLYNLLPEEKREEEIKQFYIKHSKEEDYYNWYKWFNMMKK